MLRAEMRPQWRHFWSVTRDAYQPGYGLPDDPMPTLRAKTVVKAGLDLRPARTRWDAATMFFCAESITGRQDEFEAACAAFARCVKPGGALIAAFLVGRPDMSWRIALFPVSAFPPRSIEERVLPVMLAA